MEVLSGPFLVSRTGDAGLNRTLSYGAKLFAHLDPSKGVDAYRQQDGGHGSRNPLRSV